VMKIHWFQRVLSPWAVQRNPDSLGENIAFSLLVVLRNDLTS
jgi:hypothetical protein